ncbi:polysaccharide deacetylase family protein [Microvirga pakistanensis]|uniref:polysaccharide deacetylase family protein n=1 Tax=Microvirga pakistanensis TaxID=1682650 RepID=UPI001FCEE0B7|nr:polysaccharide deacetylase family protein [Microvirga pakistanensis]
MASRFHEILKDTMTTREFLQTPAAGPTPTNPAPLLGTASFEVMIPPQEHDRFPYSAIVDRPRLHWPNGARVAVWVIPNIEHFLFDRPSSSIIQSTMGFVPDVLNYSWRDYGVRVGIWRLMDVLEKYGVKGTVALNADVCRLYPRIIEAGKALGWEWMGHGTNNSTVINGQSEDEERHLITGVLDTIEASTGARPRGWLSPALTESHRTLDILAAAGIRYVADWVNDEQPYRMRVANGEMLSLPYSVEMNDYTAFLEQGLSGEDFAQALRDQFDVLYEDGAGTGRVMSICLHPFLIGHPHRSKHFAEALAHITSRRDVWLATGSEIADWYNGNHHET